MSIVVATAAQTIPLANYAAGGPIRATDWKTLFKQHHYVFSRSGVRVQGVVWDGGGANEPYKTLTTAGYATVDQNTNRDLTSFSPQIIIPRRMYNSGAESVAITVASVGNNFNLKMTARFSDTNADFGTTAIASVVGATNTNTTADMIMTWAESHEGGSTANPQRVISLRFTAERNAGVVAGEIYGITVYSTILVAAQIPTDET